MQTRPVSGRLWLAVALGLATFVVTVGRADPQSSSADDVKAAFIFNFAKFVEWPTETMPAGVPLTLGVFGNDAIENSLRTLARGKQINGRELTIKRFGGDEMPRVHLLFLGAAERGRIPDVLRRVDGSGVLTVSDLERFCQIGGVIALAMEQNRVRFDVNLDAAERGRLKVSSKLLALARSVRTSKTGDR